jgi:hypothetical protein
VYSDNATTWTGKIALMYPSDYGYATSGGSITNRDTCLTLSLYNWKDSSYSDCKNNDYLYDSSYNQWTLMPYSSMDSYIFYVSSYGKVDSLLTNSAYNYALLPSVHPVG